MNAFIVMQSVCIYNCSFRKVGICNSSNKNYLTLGIIINIVIYVFEDKPILDTTNKQKTKGKSCYKIHICLLYNK